MTKRKNVRVRQHVAYLRFLSRLDLVNTEIPWSTLNCLYDGPPHPRLVYMVGFGPPPPNLGVWTQEDIDRIQESARVLSAELQEVAE